MLFMDNATIVLPAGAIQVSTIPTIGLFLASLQSYGDSEAVKVYLTLQLHEGGRIVGRKFSACIKMAGRTVNPYTRIDTDEEKWFKGNLTIYHNDGTFENRAFLFEFNKKKQCQILRKGRLYQFSDVPGEVVVKNPLQMELDLNDFDLLKL